MAGDFDLFTLTNANGDIWYFAPNEKQHFLSWGGFGSPPIEYQTRTGYKQDGSTVVDYRLADRSIPITLYRAGECTRPMYWAYRAELLDFMRPNWGGAMTLTLRESGGTKRAITVYPEPPPTFPPTSPDENAWNIQEDLNFIAHDPVWYNPVASTITITGSNTAQLVFPITFPIVFSPDGITFTTSVTYTGTWKSYPTITITGPYTSATIENVTTGVSIVLVIAIGAGAQRIITLTPGAQSIVDSSGNDQWGDLSPETNIVDFNIRPPGIAPEGVTGGVNVLRVTLAGGVIGQSSVVIRYNARYYGI